jgi:hypothetical protein
MLCRNGRLDRRGLARPAGQSLARLELGPSCPRRAIVSLRAAVPPARGRRSCGGVDSQWAAPAALEAALGATSAAARRSAASRRRRGIRLCRDLGDRRSSASLRGGSRRRVGNRGFAPPALVAATNRDRNSSSLCQLERAGRDVPTATGPLGPRRSRSFDFV